MKRILSLVGLSLALALLVAACGSEAVSRPESDEATRVALGLVTPTEEATEIVTEEHTEAPIEAPTEAPTEVPTEAPTEVPTEAPTEVPTEVPTEAPTEAPTEVSMVFENATEVPSGTTPQEDVIAAHVERADADHGLRLFTAEAIPTCMTCHQTDGITTGGVGPNLGGLRDRAGSRVEGQGEFTYVYNSIRYSQMHVVEGFIAGLMPSYDGVLKDQDVYDLIAYLWTLE